MLQNEKRWPYPEEDCGEGPIPDLGGPAEWTESGVETSRATVHRNGLQVPHSPGQVTFEAADMAPQTITECGYLTLDFRHFGISWSPVFLQTLAPWFPNDMQNLLSSKKSTLDHWATVQCCFSVSPGQFLVLLQLKSERNTMTSRPLCVVLSRQRWCKLTIMLSPMVEQPRLCPDIPSDEQIMLQYHIILFTGFKVGLYLCLKCSSLHLKQREANKGSHVHVFWKFRWLLTSNSINHHGLMNGRKKEPVEPFNMCSSLESVVLSKHK